LTSIAILIPVLGRPGNAEPVYRSAVENTVNEHTVYFICSPGDTEQIAACEATGARVLVMRFPAGKADFARKINTAFDATDEPWLFQGADDIVFGHGWDRHCLLAAERAQAGVVGTNDLGNPLVKRGHHSTHTLFSRAYVEEYGGGTIDNTGRVFSEVYDHEFTDNEFCQTAMARGQWAFAQRAVVEHMHPHWGKAEMDATYEKATRASAEGKALFQRRMRLVRNRVARVEQRRLQMEARQRRLGR
jgi:hypothetical protein